MIWNGTGYGAVWTEKMGDYLDIYFANLDASGVKIGDIARMTFGGSNSISPSIVWLKDKFYIAYAQGSVIKILKVDKNGAAIGNAVNVSAADAVASSPKLMINGDSLLVAWLEDDGTNNKIMSATESAQ
jgi:hypothetical protein